MSNLYSNFRASSCLAGPVNLYNNSPYWPVHCIIFCLSFVLLMRWRPSWSWSYSNWIYNYLCNQYLSPLTLWVRIPLRRGVLDTTLCDKVCQWRVAGWWFSQGTPVSSTNKPDRHDITEILLKVLLNTITLTLNWVFLYDILLTFVGQ